MGQTQRKTSNYAGYHPFKDEEGNEYGSFEVVQLTALEAASFQEDLIWDYMKRPEYKLASMNSKVQAAMLDALVEEEGIQGGWFWASGFPGCLWDSEPMGPFESSEAAFLDAMEV